MNNKDEKTFADLFSSSTSEEKEDKTFDSIFKSENTEESKNTEIKESDNNAITFDNIADNIADIETSSEKNVDLFAKAATEEQEENDSPIEQKEEQSNTDNNLFFNREDESPKEETNVFFETSSFDVNNSHEQNLEPQEVDNSFLKEELSNLEDSITTNPFFTENEEKNETTEEVEISNPFFSGQEEKNEKETVEEIKDSAEINNNNNNPFFNEPNEAIAPVIDLKLTEASPESNDEPKLDASNPFFQNDNTKEETPKTLIEEKKTQEINTESDTSKSSSPFFEEEKKEETNNPFFQGQLNLVENKQHNNPVGNIDITKSKHFDVKIVKKKDSPLKFIIGVLSYALFIFLLLIGITLLVYVLDTKIRAAKGDYSAPTFNAYVVLTGSMLPEIQVNDVVVTKKVDASTLKEGDIITFASADSRFLGTIITHRIIKKNPPDGTNGYTFQTRGDNNNVADSALVPESNIYGKVILKIPKLGYLQEFLASDGGWIIVILIPCLTVISYDVVKLIKGLKRKKYKNIKVQK